jgi:WD40 repeat protein
VVLAWLTIAAPFGQDGTRGNKFYTGGGTRPEEVGPVWVHDFSTGESREFYKPSSGVVFDLKPSPSGDLLAVSTRILKFDVNPQEATVVIGGRSILDRTFLHILAENGSEIDAIPQVRFYAWSPDGQQLAYVVGEYGGMYNDYTNTSAWIWNRADRKRTQISKDAYNVSWPQFDNNVYLWPRSLGTEGKAVRYNVSTGRLEPTTHFSIYFSPSGNYYYHPGSGTGLQENVYLRLTDLGLKGTSRVLSSLSGWRPLGWAPDADVLMMEASRRTSGGRDESAIILYDPGADTGTSLSITAAEFLGWGTTLGEIVVRNGSRVERKAITELRLSPPQ